MDENFREDFDIGAINNRSAFIGVENGPQGNLSSPIASPTVTLFPSKLERQYSEDIKHSKRNGFFDIVRQLIIVALLLAIFCGYLFETRVNYDRKSAFLFRQGLCDKDTRYTSKYAIVFDAGSTGSRVHVYEFQFCGSKLLHLVDEIFEQTKPGLSAYPENPEEAVESLVPLLRRAWRRVPRSLRRCSPILIKATAGLRLLPAEKVSKILDNIKDWIDDQPFHLPRTASGFTSEPISVIDGSEEAVSAWISVNFLQGHVGPDRRDSTTSPSQKDGGTSVVLEMGGGSAQIVFDQKDTNSLQLPGGIIDLNFFGRRFQLYQHSFLGYGLMEARKAVKLYFLDSKGTGFACYPKDHEELFKDTRIIGTSAGFKGCQEIVKGALFNVVKNNNTKCERAPCSFNGVHQPKIPENAQIYALSYINDRAGELNFDGSVGYTLGELKKRTETVCSSSMASEAVLLKNPQICLDLVFIYTLLHDGYGIPEDRKIYSGHEINNYETGWTLGSALSVIETAPTFCK